MKVAKVFEFLGVHEDIGEEHLLLRLFIQKRVIHCAYGHFRTEVAQELHSLKNKLVVVAQGTRFHQTIEMALHTGWELSQIDLSIRILK